MPAGDLSRPIPCVGPDDIVLDLLMDGVRSAGAQPVAQQLTPPKHFVNWERAFLLKPRLWSEGHSETRVVPFGPSEYGYLGLYVIRVPIEDHDGTRHHALAGALPADPFGYRFKFGGEGMVLDELEELTAATVRNYLDPPQDAWPRLHRLEETRKTERLAYEDPLTQLGNRRAFDRAIEATDASDRLTVVSIDLDGLKIINDTEGHSAGDALIQLTGECLSRILSEKQAVFRFGGDEFALVLPGPAAQTALRRLDEISEVEFSWGAASTDEALTPAELWDEADQRMYHAKKSRSR